MSAINSSEYGVCLECGANFPKTHPSCLHLFEKVIVVLSELPNHRVELRMAMDAYALQHSEQFCPHQRSIAIHLMGLCWGVEWKGEIRIAKAMQKWLEHRSDMPQIPPPFISPFQDIMTVEEVWKLIEAQKLEDVPKKVHMWANTVWMSWSEQHQHVRQWISSAIQKYPNEDQSI